MLSMIISSLLAQIPKGISYALIIYALHRYGQALGARIFVCLEVASVLVREKSKSDSNYQTQFCWRCAFESTILIGICTGNYFQYYRHPFIISCISFLHRSFVNFFGECW
ncbi:MAG: hypothetical protein EZS28_010529 [Streblomastix strix]|uniref:Uncharacterized protein n=1 Tax=Streblomastix strix TaxID=222440 RepID=A0A5J4WH01_9EUKA|nr:MAG: hypothetical protein EZS28_010529 [Streblomastix strix]